jgi:hypothetical protein
MTIVAALDGSSAGPARIAPIERNGEQGEKITEPMVALKPRAVKNEVHT